MGFDMLEITTPSGASSSDRLGCHSAVDVDTGLYFTDPMNRMCRPVWRTLCASPEKHLFRQVVYGVGSIDNIEMLVGQWYGFTWAVTGVEFNMVIICQSLCCAQHARGEVGGGHLGTEFREHD